MSEQRCALTWKAAALEDGRLEGADRTSFETHAARCEGCRAEKQAVARLYAQVRAVPVADVAPLEHARRRGALLARANERFAGRPRTNRLVWGLVASSVLGLGVYAVAVPRAASTPVVAADDAVPPRYEITEVRHAVWRHRLENATARIDLADGAASFEVERFGPKQRFVVMLPDGEIEVTGTRFSVDVVLGRTKSVSVAEGHVVFRRADAREMTLHAGEAWSRTDAVAAAPDHATQPSPSSSAAPRLGAPPTPERRPGANAAGSAKPAAHAGEEFDEAISSFVRGSYARADEQLVAFSRKYPHDSRCEDAAFLSAVARWRIGDTAGARARAQSYLDAYPSGLRRAEAERIVAATRP